MLDVKFSGKEKQGNAAKSTNGVEIDIQQSAISTRHKSLVQLIQTSVSNGNEKGRQNRFFIAEMAIMK